MKVAVVGDSHVEGLAPFLRDAFYKSGDELVFLEHHRGWSTEALLDDGAFRRAMDTDAEVVVVSAGANDAVRSANAEEAVRDALAALRGKRLLWVFGPPSTNATAELMRAQAIERVRVHGVRFIVASGLPSSDGVHLTREGYEKLAERIANALQNLPSWGVLGFLGLLAGALLAFTLRFTWK